MIRFRQFDALHHSCPLTARSSVFSAPGCDALPGLYLPAAEHWANASPASEAGGRSAGGRLLPDGSQLIPMIGTTTSAQDTVFEQPSEALVSAVVMTNLAVPSPLRLE